MDPRVEHGIEGYAFPGYTLQDDLTLRPNLDQNGNIVNPDLVLKSGVLCNLCKKITLEVETWHNRQILQGHDSEFRQMLTHIPFYGSKSEIRHSTERGCCICALFLTTEIEEHKVNPWMEYKSPSSVPDALQSWVAISCPTPKWIYMRQVRRDNMHNKAVCVGSDFNSSRQMEEKIKASEDMSAALSASNASAATFNLASSWLGHCVSEHDGCRPGQTMTSQPPTRLLDVGDSTHCQLRIVHPQIPTEYLTVSHCWGKIPRLQLDSTTEGKLVGGFDDQDLPQLFRDCVHVTRRLGFRYLWIDTLCILQDNDADKKEEISRMGDIYHGSVCNIAAVSAPHSDASLFTRYLPLGTTKTTLEKRIPATVGTLMTREIEIDFAAPLYDRAWVIQERLLAPRTLEYSHAGIRWRCGQVSRGKDRGSFKPVSLKVGPTRPVSRDFSKEWNWLLGLDSNHLSEYDKLIGQNSWMEIVSQYTASALTFERDRGVALLGVISVLQQRTGLSLSHGVCKDFFPYSLLWHTPEELPRIPPYPVPSWSSTFRTQKSLQAMLATHAKDIWLHCSEFEVDDETLFLSLKAKYCGSRMIKSDTESLGDYSSGLRVQDLDGEWTKGEFFHSGSGFTALVVLRMDYLDFPLTEVDLALLVQTSEEVGEIGRAHGLVLSKLPGEDGLWERLGVFSLYAYEDEDEILAHFGEERTYHIR